MTSGKATPSTFDSIAQLRLAHDAAVTVEGVITRMTKPDQVSPVHMIATGPLGGATYSIRLLRRSRKLNRVIEVKHTWDIESLFMSMDMQGMLTRDTQRVVRSLFEGGNYDGE